MGGFADVLSGADGLFKGNLKTDGGVAANLSQMLGGISQVGGGIAKIGGATNAAPSPMAAPSLVPHMPVMNTGAPTVGQPVMPVTATPAQGAIPMTPAPSSTGVQGVGQYTFMGSGTPIGSSGFTSIYGNDTGGAVANLLNSETPGSANNMAQNIIQANQGNVAKGSADLNARLAAAGISPSSSVSALTNADYGASVQNNNLAEISQINMNEQQMQQQLLESLLPDQKARESETSGWNIFGDVMSGLGDIAGFIPGL
jgi:hypothetical protein